MSERTYNGFTAYTNDYWSAHFTELGENLVVAGVVFGGGILKGDVHDVHEYVWTQFHHRVMPLHSGQCGGHNYRPNRNDPNELSNHSSGTASDGDSALLPNGVEALKSVLGAKGVAEMHKILAEVPELNEVIHWGGDWHYANGLTPDPMHIENHDHDLAKLARVAARIRALEGAPPVGTSAGAVADLKAVANKHGMSLVYLARLALAAAARTNLGGRLKRIESARADLKGMK